MKDPYIDAVERLLAVSERPQPPERKVTRSGRVPSPRGGVPPAAGRSSGGGGRVPSTPASPSALNTADLARCADLNPPSTAPDPVKSTRRWQRAWAAMARMTA